MIRRLLTATLCVWALFGSNGFGAENKVVEITLWQGFKFSEVGLLKQQIVEFTNNWNAAHPGQSLVIQADEVPFSDMVAKIKTAAPGRLNPDIAFVDANGILSLVYGGLALPLDTLANFPKEGIDGLRKLYVPGAFDTNVLMFKGEKHLYGLPAQTSTLALFWNKKMFREKAAELKAAGLDPERAPRDWEEFIRYGKVLNDPAKGVAAFGFNNSLWFTMPFLNQYQAEIVKRTPDGKLVADLANPRCEAAINRKVNLFLKDKVEGGAWRDGALDPDQGFANGKYAMELTGPWMIENYRKAGLDFSVALIPRVPLAEAKSLGLVPQDTTDDSTAAQALSAGNIGGQDLVICRRYKEDKDTQERYQAALDFLLFFSSEKVQKEWAEKLGQIPIALGAQKGIDLSKFPEVPTFIAQSNLARPLMPLPYGAAIETEIFNPEINLVLQGKQTTMQALKNIEAGLTRKVLDPVNEAEAAEKAASK